MATQPLFAGKQEIYSWLTVLNDARAAVMDAVKDQLPTKMSYKSICKHRALYPAAPSAEAWLEVRIDEGLRTDEYLFVCVGAGADYAASRRVVIARVCSREGTRSDRVLEKQQQVECVLKGLLKWLGPMMIAGGREFEPEQMSILLRGFSKSDQSMLEALVQLNAPSLISYVPLENPSNVMDECIRNRAFVAANSLIFACVTAGQQTTSLVGDENKPMEQMFEYMKVACKLNCLHVLAYAWSVYAGSLAHASLSLGVLPLLPPCGADPSMYDPRLSELLHTVVQNDACLCFAFLMNDKPCLSADYGVGTTPRPDREEEKNALGSWISGIGKTVASLTKKKAHAYKIPKDFDIILWDDNHPFSVARGGFFRANASAVYNNATIMHLAAECKDNAVFWIQAIVNILGTELLVRRAEDNGPLPIHNALMVANVENAEYLLNAGKTEEQVCSVGYVNLSEGNLEGVTALHLACNFPGSDEENHAKAYEAVSLLLFLKANVGTRSSLGNVPLHFACKNSHTAAANLLIAHGPEHAQVFNHFRYTPLHYAAAARCLPICMAILKSPSTSCDVATEEGETPLHSVLFSAVSRDYVKAYLSYTRASQDTKIYDVPPKVVVKNYKQGEYLYLKETKKDEVSESAYLQRVLHSLIAFDADVNSVLVDPILQLPLTALDIAHCIDSLTVRCGTSEMAVHTTRQPGAGHADDVAMARSHLLYCPMCATGSFSKLLRAVGALTLEELSSPQEEKNKVANRLLVSFKNAAGFPSDEDMFSPTKMASEQTGPVYSLIRYLSMTSLVTPQPPGPPAYSESTWPTDSIRILSLDGGGTRGVISIEVLRALERLSGYPVNKLFDLVCGTSTGGMIALALTKGKRSVDYIKTFYLKLAPIVFVGKKPYDLSLEKVVDEEFKDMCLLEEDASAPKGFAVASCVETYPLSEFLFRTYRDKDAVSDVARGTCEGKIRDAMRATSAAPMYFSAHTIDQTRFIDGGVVHNNPTLVAMTEALAHSPNALKGGVVVSIGTGAVPAELVPENTPFHIPSEKAMGLTLYNTVTKYVSTYVRLVVEGLADSEKIILPSAHMTRACGGYYVRLNPPLERLIELDMSEENELVYMLYASKVYVCTHERELMEVAHRLTARFGGPRLVGPSPSARSPAATNRPPLFTRTAPNVQLLTQETPQAQVLSTPPTKNNPFA